MSKLKVATIALVCALCLGLSGILVGCGGSQSPSQVADSYLKQMKSTTTSEAMSLLGDDSDSMDELFGQEFAKALTEKIIDFDYKIGSEKIIEDRASVEVTITTYNLGKAYTNFFTSYMQQILILAFSGATEEDAMELGVKLIKEELGNAPKDYVATVPMYLNKEDGKWVVDETDDGNIEIINALTGGLLDAYDQILEQYAGLVD